jgi:hypothetical protein
MGNPIEESDDLVELTESERDLEASQETVRVGF